MNTKNKSSFKRNDLWKITTEGDVEGRTTRDLGVHEGNIDELAFALAHKACYKLEFEAVNTKKVDVTVAPQRSEVHIEVVGLNQFSLIDILKDCFKDADNGIHVVKSNYYNGVKLNLHEEKKSPEEEMKIKLEKAGFNVREVINTFKQR